MITLNRFDQSKIKFLDFWNSVLCSHLWFRADPVIFPPCRGSTIKEILLGMFFDMLHMSYVSAEHRRDNWPFQPGLNLQLQAVLLHSRASKAQSPGKVCILSPFQDWLGKSSSDRAEIVAGIPARPKTWYSPWLLSVRKRAVRSLADSSISQVGS